MVIGILMTNIQWHDNTVYNNNDNSSRVQEFDITSQDFEVEYNYSGAVNITFTIDEIVLNNAFSFQQIPIRVSVELPVLEARLAHRIVQGERELMWNIIVHEDELVLDTRGSVGDNVLVEINGGTPMFYDFGILKQKLPCVDGRSVIVPMIPTMSSVHTGASSHHVAVLRVTCSLFWTIPELSADSRLWALRLMPSFKPLATVSIVSSCAFWIIS